MIHNTIDSKAKLHLSISKNAILNKLNSSEDICCFALRKVLKLSHNSMESN